MTSKEFERLSKKLTNQGTGLFDINLINELTDEIKHNIVCYLVRHRMFIPEPFILKSDIQWLHSCGYLYYAKNKHFLFYITSEHQKHFKKEQLLNYI